MEELLFKEFNIPSLLTLEEIKPRKEVSILDYGNKITGII